MTFDAHTRKLYASLECKDDEIGRGIAKHLGTEAFSYYDVNTHSWKLDPGKYRILIGASSQDIRLEVPVTL